VRWAARLVKSRLPRCSSLKLDQISMPSIAILVLRWAARLVKSRLARRCNSELALAQQPLNFLLAFLIMLPKVTSRYKGKKGKREKRGKTIIVQLVTCSSPTSLEHISLLSGMQLQHCDSCYEGGGPPGQVKTAAAL
jgi:hypothetical protein